MPSRRHFDEMLGKMRQDLLSMGFETETMLRDAVSALVEQNAELARTIVASDDMVDQLQVSVERQALLLIALQQPVVATDLRMVFTAFKATTDIERIGDHALNIARTVLRMGDEGLLYQPLVDVPLLGGKVRDVLHETLEALVRNDAERARAVIAADDGVDELYARMREHLQQTVRQDRESAAVGAHLLMVVHSLERVGDHCVNIAERLAFLLEGEALSEDTEG